jgi:hypothetical protein
MDSIRALKRRLGATLSLGLGMGADVPPLYVVERGARG